MKKSDAPKWFNFPLFRVADQGARSMAIGIALTQETSWPVAKCSLAIGAPMSTPGSVKVYFGRGRGAVTHLTRDELRQLVGALRQTLRIMDGEQIEPELGDAQVRLEEVIKHGELRGQDGLNMLAKSEGGKAGSEQLPIDTREIAKLSRGELMAKLAAAVDKQG